MHRFIRFALIVFAIVAPLHVGAQSSSVAIDPGMSRDDVVARFGRPATERSRGTFTYLFYGNGREQTVGMADLVILEDGKVVDAILRSPLRTYSGISSSPRAIPAAEAARSKTSSPPPGRDTPRPSAS